jgi:hypothetical protein
MAIPAAILFFIIAIQRTIIHTGGISISGVLWAWGDFQAYEWGENTRQKLTVQLHIKTDYRVPIKLVIPVNYKQQIEEILTKNLKI